MAKSVHHILACYDIHDPERLRRVAKIMKDYGERVLKSVFECNLTYRNFESMKQQIDQTIDHIEDSVRFYFICGKCISNTEYSGKGTGFVKDDEFSII